MKRFNLGPNQIGEGFSCFIIAEAGVNHNGSIELAKKLVDEAKIAGADCIKFQTYRTENLVTVNAPKANYQLQVTDKTESQFEMLKKLELSLEDYKELVDYCCQKQILFLSTPYNFEDIDFLYDLGVTGFKVASGQLTEAPFLDYMAKKQLPMIISTGMASLDDIKAAQNILIENNLQNYVFLQCTTNYPADFKESNIKAMTTIKDELDCLVGYSDHTENELSILAAVARDACIIEKHFTLDKTMEGPDHSCSADPEELKDLITKIRNLELALGSSIKAPSASEKQNIKGMKRSLVAKVQIKEGETITSEHLAFKRPATGLAPNEYWNLLGKKAKCEISQDEVLTSEMFE